MTPRRVITTDEVDEWERQYIAGSSCAVIAKHAKTDRSTVAKYLRLRNVPMRPSAPPMQQITAETILEVQRSQEPPLSYRQIAALLGCSVMVVHDRLNRVGRTRAQSPRYGTEIDDWAALYEGGLTYREIAAEAGISPTTVWSHLEGKVASRQPRPRGGPTT